MAQTALETLYGCLQKRVPAGARVLIVPWVMLTVCGLASAVFRPPAAAGPLPSAFTLPPEIPWEIQADIVEYDAEADVYVARNGVRITRGDTRLTADHVRFDHKNMTASARGHVVMTAGADTLSGEQIDINLKDETGTLTAGDIFIRESNFHITGETIRKVGKNDYLASRASLTSCDGDAPAWRITGKNLDITIEGYGEIRHAALWVKDVPVLYSPYLFFPVKTRRQSGFLSPEFGSSDRRGLEYRQPFFWALSDSRDLTLYNHFMSERGDRIGAEYRYVLDEYSKGTLMMDYLDDRKVDDGGSGDYGYEGDGEIRTNHDRYWLRAKIDQMLPADIRTRLDLDIVSDQDYLYEFKTGYGGYDETTGYFEKAFGREIDDYNDPIRANSFTMNKNTSGLSMNAQFLWYDHVANRRWHTDDSTLQRLPLVTLNAVKQSFLDSPFYWSADTQCTYFYRKDGARGQRIHLHPRIYWPKAFQSHLFVEPSAGYRQTVWHVDDFGEADRGSDRIQHRELGDVRVDLSTRLNRSYRISEKAESGGGGVETRPFWPEEIRHQIRPRLTYEFIPETRQEDQPFFDPLDRIPEKNRITLALVNTLTSRSPAPDPSPSSKPDENSISSLSVFRRFLRFELSQSYEMNAYASDDLLYELALDDPTAPEPGKHLSPMSAKLEITPADYFSIQADTEWSHASARLNSRNVALSLFDGRGDRAFVEYRFTDDVNESVYAHITVTVASRVTAFAQFERNIRDRETLKTGLGILYDAQCWSFLFQYLRDREDNAFGLMVNLKGLGEIGSR